MSHFGFCVGLNWIIDSIKMAVRGVLLVVLAGVTLTWGQGTQVTVEHPILGQIVGQQGVTSRDQTAYWTFHGIRKRFFLFVNCGEMRVHFCNCANFI